MNNTTCSVQREPPRYRSHKEVYAWKIKTVEPVAGGGAVLHVCEDGYLPIHVDAAYVVKHAPKQGGYLVIYQDGYRSWSPAEAFESGYSRV